ncbi:MAG TPA: lysophospholipid acyltransferase family protein [Bacteroidales bacterium]|mgnify:CR=1 FL=1|nr:lysophospholipid acyltransferase family protein [Bacteroidales bacterium]HPT21301.1 lysophospholipid acyltransferase family protein [Bacteroidales bacterium]
MHKGYFDSYSYNTPEREHLSFREKMLLNNRLYFTCEYGKIVLRTRKEAIRKVYDTKAWTDSSFEIFKVIEKTGGKFHITGMENITKVDGPVLFISNHMSTLEAMILPGIIGPHKELTFVVKESLVLHPLFGDVMKSRNPVVVGRTDPRKDFEVVMTEGVKILSAGTSIVIFPQSTRRVDFKPEEFHSMGIKLAKKAGVWVVPIALKTDFWGNGKLIKELGPIDRHKEIYIKFGEPFPVSGTGKDDNQKIIDFIQSSLKEWNQVK